MLLDRLKKKLNSGDRATGGHRQKVVSHMEVVQRALAGQKEYLLRLAQMRQTSPMGHDSSKPIPTKDCDG